MLEGIWRDFAYAWRRHRRHPALALAIGATLALAIGLNASVFVIYEAVALRPWAVPGADHLVNIYTSPPDRPRGSAAIGASLAHVRYSTPTRRCSTAWPPPASCRCNLPTATRHRLHPRKW